MNLYISLTDFSLDPFFSLCPFFGIDEVRNLLRAVFFDEVDLGEDLVGEDNVVTKPMSFMGEARFAAYASRSKALLCYATRPSWGHLQMVF